MCVKIAGCQVRFGGAASVHSTAVVLLGVICAGVAVMVNYRY